MGVYVHHHWGYQQCVFFMCSQAEPLVVKMPGLFFVPSVSLTHTDNPTFDLPTVYACCSHSAFLLSYCWSCSEGYIILSTSKLSTYRINNATVKPITWLHPQINSSHSSWISHGWLNWFSTVKWSSNKQAFPTWKGSDSHQTWTLCRWQIIPAGNRRYS